MQASKATVDEVLEAIADCILQCVLFSTEADETGAKVLFPLYHSISISSALQSLSSGLPLFISNDPFFPFINPLLIHSLTLFAYCSSNPSTRTHCCTP
jgi:hypothetical protein